MKLQDNIQMQKEMEQVELYNESQPTVSTLIEQLSILDRYIYTARHEVNKLSIKDATSVAYTFAATLLEVLVGLRADMIAEFTSTLMSTLSTENVGLILEEVAKKVKKSSHAFSVKQS